MPKATIDGVDYEVEVRNGERFIDGKTVDGFLDTLPIETIRRLAQVGWFRLNNEVDGVGDSDGIYQEKLSEIEFLEY